MGDIKQMKTSINTKKIFENDNIDLSKKIMLASLGAMIIGRQVNTKLRGTKKEINAISSILSASKNLHEEIKSPNASIESIMEKLNIKKNSAFEFEKIFGVPWPL